MLEHLNEIQKKLRGYIIHEKLKLGLNRLSIFISFMCIISLVFVLLEAVGNFNSEFRTVLFYVLISIVLLSFLLQVFYPFIKDLFYLKNPDFIEAARIIGIHFQEIKDELSNSLQLIDEQKRNNSNQLVSNQLIEAAFENVYNKTEKLNFNSVVDFSSTKKLLKISISFLLITILLTAAIPGLNSAAYRLINYNKSFTQPQKFFFQIEPGNAEITKGENVTISIKIIGKGPSQIILATKSEEETEFVEKKLSSDSLGIFNYEAITVKSSFEYYAFADGIKSEIYKINVINRPIITSLELNIIPPAYSKLSPITQKDNGNITALKGSKVKLTINSSRQLSKAVLSFGDSSVKQMLINNTNAFGEFNVVKETNYKILIEDTQDISNVNPITYSIKIIYDELPSIEMIAPTDNIKLRNDSKISLISRIKDDYGFSKLTLNYQLTFSKYREPAKEYSVVSIPINKELKEDEIYYTWDLSPLVLAEGEMLSYYLEIFDNDNVSGPKSAKTKIFTILVPSIDELFTEAENTQQDAVKELSETLKEAENLNQEMQKISNELKQNKRDITWQEKERIEKAAEKFKVLMQKADEISQKLSEMKNNLMQNNLLSEETLQKYNELQKLLDEMSSKEMKEVFKRLQETLQSLMRDNVQMSLEELKANEEYFKKSLERTLNLLKRIQVEQEIDELIKRTEELSQKIEELKNKTELSNLLDKQSRDELSKRQKDVTEDLNSLEEEMKKLEDKMGELRDSKDLPKEQLKKAMEEYEKQNNQELSEEALKGIQQMQKQQAIRNQQQLSSNMSSMNNHFKNLQSAMQQMNQVKTYYDMMKILDDLLTLSDMQEKLKNETEKLSYNSPEFNKNSRKQNEIQNNLNKILQKMTELSQKTFAITPEMGKALGKSFSEMQQSIGALQNRNSPLAAQFQNRAMEHLNEAANLIKGGMEQMMNGGQGAGMMSLFQQLQQLSQQQMNLNQLTQMLNQGKLSQEMMSQLQRLAQEQELIRKSLEQLNKEAQESGQSKRLAANLEKIMEEMKEIVTNLQTEKLNDELIKQQERILSRLLDAQRSINERDYEKDRKSNAGKNIARTSPPELILSTEEGKNKLRDELQKAIREGYKKDYEDLIRKYFEALEKER